MSASSSPPSGLAENVPLELVLRLPLDVLILVVLREELPHVLVDVSHGKSGLVVLPRLSRLRLLRVEITQHELILWKILLAHREDEAFDGLLIFINSGIEVG